ncbi:methyltransferase [Paenibacillus sp. JCM 10914]|uniref:RsmD family RNA methyltransferase n=1 Tax=Paenibacillus sp. JCM 10914 TaxID=1236974 RepID=UPI0003CC47E2|nr:RsmD family RNA methyltransferase [Paenibacillus sp. JCM 10914]GAE07293.1 UPF0020, Putative RNA methylase family UPF0020 [Paenibacillus sp. JCM 10914]
MNHVTDERVDFGTAERRDKSGYVYTYACHETERELCLLELGELFGREPDGTDWLSSRTWVNPDRSPFITAFLDVRMTGSSIEELSKAAAGITLAPSSEETTAPTFKVTCLKAGESYSYDEMRAFERIVGQQIRGKAQMKNPDITFGLISIEGTWQMGLLHAPAREWLKHKCKPQNYSTGLSSRLARSLVNIVAPKTEGRTMIDPCCGMGNVLIEALSMGISIEGRDLNPLAIRGARVNLQHYGYDNGIVAVQDMNELQGHYDTAILDMPYNVCSVLPEDEKIQMLGSLRHLADRAVIVSSESIRSQLEETGWHVLRHATASRGSFVRDIWLCE